MATNKEMLVLVLEVMRELIWATAKSNCSAVKFAGKITDMLDEIKEEDAPVYINQHGVKVDPMEVEVYHENLGEYIREEAIEIDELMRKYPNLKTQESGH